MVVWMWWRCGWGGWGGKGEHLWRVWRGGVSRGGGEVEWLEWVEG